MTLLRRLLLLLTLSAALPAYGQQIGAAPFDMGSPTLQTIYVDPVAGSDERSGSTRETALRSINAAWNRIPRNTPLSIGYRILLLPGDVPESDIPNYWEERIGTYGAPIILQAETPRQSRLRGDINAFKLSYFYLIGVDIVPDPLGDAFHCEQCDHVVLRDSVLRGGNGDDRRAQETVKINQSQFIFIEGCDIGGATDNAIDFVSVQYGHILGNKVHDADDWCGYVKGGSAYLTVEANEFYNCGTGGFTAGQGTGFEFMTSPWIHFETYDIKVVNNIVHDTEGAGLGVNGGYNVLLAFNTLYRVGSRSHALEVVFGARSCDGNTARCNQLMSAGGWGQLTRDDGPIPNRNVFVLNNIIYNPPGFVAPQHFAIYGPRTTTLGTLPSPSTTDSGLRIRGNVIFNGDAGTPVGIEDENQGCRPDNPTCNLGQLLAENTINEFEPRLRAASAGDFRPATNSNLFGPGAAVMIAFPGGDREPTPSAPEGELSNEVGTDRGGSPRSVNVAGAYASTDSSLFPPSLPPPSGGDGGGGGGGGGADTEGPTLRKVKATAVRVRGRVKVALSLTASDSSGVESARAVTAFGQSVALNRRGTSARYQRGFVASGVPRRARRLQVTITVEDTEGNLSSKTLRPAISAS